MVILLSALVVTTPCLHAAPFLHKDLLSNRLDPALEYRSLSTPHFTIHYPADRQGLAERVAETAELVHAKVAEALDWKPDGRTNIVLVNRSDH